MKGMESWTSPPNVEQGLAGCIVYYRNLPKSNLNQARLMKGSTVSNLNYLELSQQGRLVCLSHKLDHICTVETWNCREITMTTN